MATVQASSGYLPRVDFEHAKAAPSPDASPGWIGRDCPVEFLDLRWHGHQPCTSQHLQPTMRLVYPHPWQFQSLHTVEACHSGPVGSWTESKWVHQPSWGVQSVLRVVPEQQVLPISLRADPFRFFNRGMTVFLEQCYIFATHRWWWYY